MKRRVPPRACLPARLRNVSPSPPAPAHGGLPPLPPSLSPLCPSLSPLSPSLSSSRLGLLVCPAALSFPAPRASPRPQPRPAASSHPRPRRAHTRVRRASVCQCAAALSTDETASPPSASARPPEALSCRNARGPRARKPPARRPGRLRLWPRRGARRRAVDAAVSARPAAGGRRRGFGEVTRRGRGTCADGACRWSRPRDRARRQPGSGRCQWRQPPCLV